MKFNKNVTDCSSAPIAEAWTWLDNPDDPELIDVCQAVPAYPPHSSLLEYLASELANGNATNYTDIRGIESLRNALANDIESRYNASINADDVVITAGCNQAFCSVIDLLCQPGDNVIIPSPCYFNYPMWLQIRDIDVHWIPFNQDTGIPSPDLVTDLIDEQTRAIVLVSPNNPTGAIYPAQTISAFHAIAKSHDIPLVIDETYRDFMDESTPPHNLFQSENWQDNFIHLYSFSKAFSLTGHRVGAVVAGPDVTKQLIKIQDCVLISAPHSGQLAAQFGLEHLQWWRSEKSQEIIDRADAIRRSFSIPDLKYQLICAGAYFAYVKHPFNEPAKSVAKRLAQNYKIVSLPGSYFGEEQEAFLRIAFANVESEKFPELVNRLRDSQP